MADQETIVEQQPEVVTPTITDIWGGTPITKKEETPVVEEKKEEPNTETKVETKESNDEIVDANEYLKTNLGFDNWEAAKAAIEEYNTLKNAKPNEETFVNDDSKRMYEALLAGQEDEVYSILEQKKTFQKAEKLNVEDAAQAAQLLQLNLQLRHKDLSQKEIYDWFDEQYGKPDKPQKTFELTEDEYELKLEQWKARCDALDRKIVRDAKIIRPDVLKLKTEIVLKDIQKPQPETAKPKEPTQEELAAIKAAKEGWINAANTSVNSLNGFSTTLKFKDGDKDVEIPVSYGLSQDEKTDVMNRVNQFANNNFDVLSLFKERWVNKDGSDNVGQMVKDLSWLLYGEKAASKFANDAASQRLENYLKTKKNININETSSAGNFNPNEKSENEKLATAVWG